MIDSEATTGENRKRPETMTDLRHPRMNPISNEFASTFSLFEHAMKTDGCLREGKRGQVESCWETFTRKYPRINGLFDKLKDSEPARYIIEKPPRERAIVNGALSWRDKEPVDSMEKLWRAVKRVRNNLFHGDKVEWKPERDTKLMKAALAVIDALLEAAPGVRDRFEDGLRLSEQRFK